MEYYQRDNSSIFQNYWSPAVCLNFCDRFLRLVDREMEGINDPNHVRRFEYNPARSDCVNVQTLNGIDYESFLPKWYIDGLEKET